MKSTGIVRKVDRLGRVVLPIELRKVLGLEVGTAVEIFTDNGSLVMRRFDFGGSKQIVTSELRAARNFVDDPEKLKAIDTVLTLYSE